MSTKNKIMLSSLLALSMSAMSATIKTDTASVMRCIDVKTHKIEYHGNVTYYVNGDTLFMSRQFSYVHIIRSDKATGKMILTPSNESVVIKQRKGPWWYAIIKKYPASSRTSVVTAIALRNCKDTKEPKYHICCDAYLYNVTNEIGRSRTKGSANTNVQKILNILNSTPRTAK